MEVFKLAQLKCESLSSFAEVFCIEICSNLEHIWIVHHDELQYEKVRDCGRKCRKLWSNLPEVNSRTPHCSSKSKPFKPTPIFKDIVKCFKTVTLIEYLFDWCCLLMKYDNGSFEALDDGTKLNALLFAQQRTINKKRKHIQEINLITPTKKPKLSTNSPDLFEKEENRLARNGKRCKRSKRKFEIEPKLNEQPCSLTLRSEAYLDMILYCCKWEEKMFDLGSVDDLMLHIINLPLPVSHQMKMLDEWFTASAQWLQLRLILQKFINNEAILSKNHGYKNVLKKHLKSSNKYYNENKCCAPILKTTVISFICDVLRRTIPKTFFGKTNRHRKEFVSNVVHIIRGQKNQLFSLSPFSQGFDQSLSWKTEMAPLFQRYMPVKICKFLLTGFVLKIIKGLFYVTECGPTGFELFYYMKADVSSKLIQQRDIWQEIGKIKPLLIPESDAIKLPSAKIRLLPKSPSFDECRAITIVPKLTDKPVQDKIIGLKCIANILDCMLSCYGTGIKPISSNPLLMQTWQKIIHLKETSGSKVYFVKADIVDAFGSIDHERLIKVIDHFCPENSKGWPELFIKEWCCTRGKLTVLKRFSFSRKLHHNRVLLSRKLSFKMGLTTSQFKEVIRKIVCEQHLKVGRKIFLLSCGLFQGGAGPLSNRLCDLYYSAMDITFFCPLLKDGNALFLRGTDDYLFVTTDIVKAHQFHTIVQQGIPRYNARFNPKKMQTNLYEDNLNVTYLGLDFNFQNFHIEPNYDRYNDAFLNFIKLNVTRNDSYLHKLTFLKQRSFQIHVLKLISIVCTTNINNAPRVIRKISNLYANRTLELALFLKPTTSDLISIIAVTANKFCRHFPFDSLEVKNIFWTEVKNVFQKYSGNYKGIFYELSLKLRN